MSLPTDDCAAGAERLEAKGVAFIQEPARRDRVSSTTGWPVASPELKALGRQLHPGRTVERLRYPGTGNLITGRQNFSGGDTADLMIETLGR